METEHKPKENKPGKLCKDIQSISHTHMFLIQSSRAWDKQFTNTKEIRFNCLYDFNQQ